MKKRNFKNGFYNLGIYLRMVLVILFGAIKLLLFGALVIIAVKFIQDIILLLSKELGAKYNYAGYVAPFAALTSVFGFIYKHINDKSKNIQDKLVPVLADVIQLRNMKKMTKDKKALIYKLQATILLAKKDTIIDCYQNYLDNKFKNKYLDAIIELLRHEIRRKTDAQYVLFYYLEDMLGRDKIQELRDKLKK